MRDDEIYWKAQELRFWAHVEECISMMCAAIYAERTLSPQMAAGIVGYWEDELDAAS